MEVVGRISCRGEHLRNWVEKSERFAPPGEDPCDFLVRTDFLRPTGRIERADKWTVRRKDAFPSERLGSLDLDLRRGRRRHVRELLGVSGTDCDYRIHGGSFQLGSRQNPSRRPSMPTAPAGARLRIASLTNVCVRPGEPQRSTWRRTRLRDRLLSDQRPASLVLRDYAIRGRRTIIR